ncbi:hypothetical protein [Actinoplanes sp. NPDC049118]|uniref:hypothetical protein n=1 Tax=Actinoplanes sp. NPDC049118 TaxID=3155769 RepID=UPI0033ED1927
MSEPLPAFDGQNPPIDPPAGCVNTLVWRLSRRLFADHRPGPDGWCLRCRPAITYPCMGRQLADRGLVYAMTGRLPAVDREWRHRNQGERW